MKAVGRRLPWKEIEVTMDGPRPTVCYQGKVYEAVSISHEREYAVAVVVLPGQGGASS